MPPAASSSRAEHFLMVFSSTRKACLPSLQTTNTGNLTIAISPQDTTVRCHRATAVPLLLVAKPCHYSLPPYLAAAAVRQSVSAYRIRLFRRQTESPPPLASQPPRPEAYTKKHNPSLQYEVVVLLPRRISIAAPAPALVLKKFRRQPRNLLHRASNWITGF